MRLLSFFFEQTVTSSGVTEREQREKKTTLSGKVIFNAKCWPQTKIFGPFWDLCIKQKTKQKKVHGNVAPFWAKTMENRKKKRYKNIQSQMELFYIPTKFCECSRGHKKSEKFLNWNMNYRTMLKEIKRNI